MVWFILLSSFTVSIDSLLCGFSLSLDKERKSIVVLGITLTVFIMCLFANYLTLILKNYLTEKSTSIGGLILIFIGLFNLIKKDENTPNNLSGIKKILLTGFAVGLDGAFLNLSLAIMGLNYFYVPLLIAIMHGIAISIGILISSSPLLKKIEKYSFISPLVLICLGLYKFTALFY